MWAILDWTNPNRLGTESQWKHLVVKPLTVGQSASASEEERSKALVSFSPISIVYMVGLAQRLTVN